ncbi:SLC12A8 [Lepeophtheirus salmonis]|uniref:SLC12A8 n=1 Tax=Lepeophtheirus salmonis TaxID=72036 RepID=A0A7R8CM49_LEPSM|nr:SLC12A8 [Lepeophtheirus salmonis]CAF2859781.1 SLC12A8 [Lepeophtheirus salmonis]
MSKKDSERQPLQSGGGNTDLYGGQKPQDDTELFADHQGSEAPPWWLSHFLVSEKVFFGTWDGVYTSCLINIFGVIVFLRSGWMVAQAGMGGACLIVLSATGLILLAVLSAIGICERCHVQSGGVYFFDFTYPRLKKRCRYWDYFTSLDRQLEMHCVQRVLVKPLQVLFMTLLRHGLKEVVAALVIILLTCINLAGVKWVVRLQFVLLIILLLGAADFGFGSLRTSKDTSKGFIGWNFTLIQNNFHEKYTGHHNWFSVFGVFFPALTGVMAGINMSGDLRNPSRDIAVGTLSAVGTGYEIFIL